MIKVSNGDGSLEIKKSNFEDTGLYKCKGTTAYHANTVDLVEIYLTVTNRNETVETTTVENLFDALPIDTVANQYNEVLIECSPLAQYQNTVDLIWIKDGITLDTRFVLRFINFACVIAYDF